MYTVLILDDDEDLREMVSLGLQQFGLKVCCYSEHSDIDKKIAGCQPNVILMDIYIGDADGRRICYGLKNSQHKNIPVILYSAGYIPSLSIEESLANDFIQKPFNFAQLVEKIKTLAA